MDERTDETIAVLVQSGDVEAFGFLVERYEKKLQRYARKFLFGVEDVEDLVQDVFLKAYENIHSFDPKRKFSPWIYRIAHNEFINALKRKISSPVAFFDPDILFPMQSAPERADTEAMEREVKEMLDLYIAKLDVKYREPLILYYYEELNYQEIADVLKIPISTVGVRLGRGKAQLKSLMNKAKAYDQ